MMMRQNIMANMIRSSCRRSRSRRLPKMMAVMRKKSSASSSSLCGCYYGGGGGGGGGGLKLMSRQQHLQQQKAAVVSASMNFIRQQQQQQQQQKRHHVTATSVSAHAYVQTPPAAIIAVEPQPQQIKNYFITTMIPMLGFGFMDQTVMIQAGNLIDCSIGVYFGLSTLAAAALGQVVSGAVAALFGGTMDQLFNTLGLPRSGLTAQQRLLPVVTRTKVTANFIGVVIGCMLGLINLLFIDTDQASMMKLEAALDDDTAEFSYEIKASNKIRKDATVVEVCGPDIKGVLASLTSALAESDFDLKEVRAGISSTSASLPATTVTAITPTRDKDSTTATITSPKTIDDVIVVCKDGQQVPNEELEELAQLLLAATKSPINLLRAQAKALEVENLKERVSKLETLLRERQVQVEEG